jgi:NADPH:quinone reductase-like Zn-dependent oxidoreductase
MNAPVVKKFEAPPVYEPFPEPSLENGEITVQVRAAGLLPVVKVLANGTHYGSTGNARLVFTP